MINELDRISTTLQHCPASRTPSLDTAHAVLDEAAKLQRRSARAAERRRRPESEQPGTTARSPRRPASRKRSASSAKAAGKACMHPVEYRRPGPAEADCDALHRNAERGQPVVRAVSAADRRRDRSAADRRYRRAEASLRAEADRGRMDRHDEPDRAAGRLRSRAGAHARRAAGRRHVSRCSARRSSSRAANTTWRRTSSISCWRVRPMRPKA